MKILYFLAITIMTSSCDVARYLVISDGSKADGTITMMHKAGAFETSVVQWDDALNKARVSCKEWGYSDAKFFETVTHECTSYNEYGSCSAYNVYYKAQCISPIVNQIDTTSTKAPPPTQIKKSKVDRLRELKQLLDDDILTMEEYNKEKEKILNEVE